MPKVALILFMSIGFFLAGCAGPRPVLYPNAALEQRDADRVEQDVDACMARAERYAGDSRAGRVAGETVKGGAVGGAGGAAAGAVFGNVGQGAAAGAAFGAAGSLVHGLFNSRDYSPVYRQFVDRCLREKGYDPIGWQ